ncbi:MAG: type IV toxin-antitoxin system AbiEi family antitoxin domain-containing protein [Nocardioidaceae bacterium]
MFTYAQARALGVSDRRLYGWRDAGVVEQVGRGLYRRVDVNEVGDPDLVEVAHRVPEATLCLGSALARHGLTDLIPPVIDVAVPRTRRRPRVQAPVAWHRFASETFGVGRDELRVDAETVIGLYSPVRTVIDVFRLRHREGPDVAYEGLRRWLARREAQPSVLLAMARQFPQAEPALRQALEVLL